MPLGCGCLLWLLKHLEISCKRVCWWRTKKARFTDSSLLVRWELACARLCTHAWVYACTYTHICYHSASDQDLSQRRTAGWVRNDDGFPSRAGLPHQSTGLGFIPHPLFPPGGKMAEFTSWHLVIKGRWLITPGGCPAIAGTKSRSWSLSPLTGVCNKLLYLWS